jgi:hypothetical protein
MNEKKFNRLVNNPRHIPSVFNYCDRWCKHCPLTLRCSVFAVGEIEDKDHHPPHNKSDESLWPRLESLQPLADKLLKDHADHPGIPVAKNPRFNKVAERTLRKSTLGAAAQRYMEFAHEFVKEWGGPEETPEKLLTLPAIANSPVTLTEAFDIIAWFHYMIPVKLSRALSHDELDEEMENDPEMKDMPRDQDGSAKIALIAIDRSILVWAALSQIETLTATALPALVTLDRLRRNVEKQFPKARPFIRPGFDTLRFR